MEFPLELFCNKVFIKILCRLYSNNRPRYISTLSKEINATYTHTYKVITDLEECGIVERISKGKKYLVALTNKGELIAREIIKIELILEE